MLDKYLNSKKMENYGLIMKRKRKKNRIPHDFSNVSRKREYFDGFFDTKTPNMGKTINRSRLTRRHRKTFVVCVEKVST